MTLDEFLAESNKPIACPGCNESHGAPGQTPRVTYRVVRAGVSDPWDDHATCPNCGFCYLHEPSWRA